MKHRGSMLNLENMLIFVTTVMGLYLMWCALLHKPAEKENMKVKMKCKTCKIHFQNKEHFEDTICECNVLTCPHHNVAQLVLARRDVKIEIEVDAPMSGYIDL